MTEATAAMFSFNEYSSWALNGRIVNLGIWIMGLFPVSDETSKSPPSRRGLTRGLHGEQATSAVWLWILAELLGTL